MYARSFVQTIANRILVWNLDTKDLTVFTLNASLLGATESVTSFAELSAPDVDPCMLIGTSAGRIFQYPHGAGLPGLADTGGVTQKNIVYVSDRTTSPPKIKPAKADVSTTCRDLYFTPATIAAASTGKVYASGMFTSTLTNSGPLNAPVYLSDTTAGGLQATKPTGDSLVKRVGYFLTTGANAVVRVDLGCARDKYVDYACRYRAYFGQERVGYEQSIQRLALHCGDNCSCGHVTVQTRALLTPYEEDPSDGSAKDQVDAVTLHKDNGEVALSPDLYPLTGGLMEIEIDSAVANTGRWSIDNLTIELQRNV